MIVIVGGTGRLGRLVVRGLSTRGLPVRVVSRNPSRATPGMGPLVQTMAGDVRDPATLIGACCDATVVVSAMHGFAGSGGGSPATVDRDGNVNLIDAAGAANADVVLMSVVGASPESPMELFRMKCAAEQYLKGSGIPGTVVRCTAFLELWIDIMRQTASRSGRPIVFGHGANPIDFVSVIDVAALVGHVVVDGSSRGRTLEIGGPQRLTFNDVAHAIQAAAGRTGSARHVPRLVSRLGSNALGRIRPAVGRQLGAALTMDTIDLGTAAPSGRQAYPDVPSTTLDMCLAVAPGRLTPDPVRTPSRQRVSRGACWPGSAR